MAVVELETQSVEEMAGSPSLGMKEECSRGALGETH